MDWKPSDDWLTYFSFSQGFRGAAFSGQAFNAPAELNFASPEKINSSELGLKAALWNRRAEFDAALFHYDYRNQQFLDTFLLPGGAGTGFHTVNAPKSRVDGAEFELRLRATHDLQIRSGLGLLSSKYQELTLHGANLSGNTLIQAPAHTVADARASFESTSKQGFAAGSGSRTGQSPVHRVRSCATRSL